MALSTPAPRRGSRRCCAPPRPTPPAAAPRSKRSRARTRTRGRCWNRCAVDEFGVDRTPLSGVAWSGSTRAPVSLPSGQPHPRPLLVKNGEGRRRRPSGRNGEGRWAGSDVLDERILAMPALLAGLLALFLILSAIKQFG